MRLRKLSMTPLAKRALQNITEALSKVSDLAHINTDKIVVVLQTDDSIVVVGTELQKTVNGKTQPLLSSSRKLQLAQSKYSKFGREPPAI